MPLYFIFALALIQGITEFLPISSSGHLALFHAFTDVESSQAVFEQNLLIDVSVHVGTLLSVLLYFRKEIIGMLCGLKNCVFQKKDNADGRLALHIFIASLPVIIAGFLMNYFEFYWGHAVALIGWTTLIFGILLWVIDVWKPAEKKLQEMSLFHAFLIGLSQVLALVPGTSRSGITMTAARYFGYSRTDAAKFSLFLAIVAISGAGTLGTINLIKMDDVAFTYDALIAMAMSFVSAWIVIVLMMKWLEHASFKIFAIYRIILGIALLVLAYSGFIH